MAEKRQLKICAVCMKIFGERSSKIQNVSSALALSLSGRTTTPPKPVVLLNYICCSCKINLYVLGRGDTAKLSAWMNSLTQVMMFDIFCQYIIKVYGRLGEREAYLNV